MSKNKIKPVDRDELIDIAVKMAQELREIIDEAKEAGCVDPFPGIELLLDDWEAIYKRTDQCWQTVYAAQADCEPEFLENL